MSPQGAQSFGESRERLLELEQELINCLRDAAYTDDGHREIGFLLGCILQELLWSVPEVADYESWCSDGCSIYDLSLIHI